jgi:CubicO group peptidase (beta-lactamase class C family)
MRKKKYQLTILLTCLALFSLKLPLEVENVTSYPVNTYPTNGWPTATLEEVGIYTSRVEQMYQYIVGHEELGIESIAIVKNGYLCYEKEFEFYNYSTIHNTITKSVTSTLIGIANSTGMITDLDEPVVEIFTNRTIQNLDAKKEAITIRHLLAMRSGLEWNELDVAYFTQIIPFNDFTMRTNTTNGYPGTWIDYYNPENDFPRQINTSDWIQYVLDKPMVADPGTEFYYNTGVTHLLSAILREKTGMNPEAFAKQYLFDPLNITDYHWWKDPSGLSIGGAGLWLTPHDMLKIGYLYLNNGNWNNTQIIPETWIQESSQDHSPEFHTEYGYGYQWWINKPRKYYFALGLGGQTILVLPDKELVVAITAWESVEDIILTSVINTYILKLMDPPTPTTTTTTTTTTAASINSLSILLGMITFSTYSLRRRRRKK